MTIERRYKGAFNVYKPDGNRREFIDTVFWQTATIDEVRRSLIDHDGYDSDIEVVPEVGTIVPLTDGELEAICDENEVSVAQSSDNGDNGLWTWRQDDEGCDSSFNTKREAMEDAVAALELDTYEGDAD